HLARPGEARSDVEQGGERGRAVTSVDQELALELPTGARHPIGAEVGEALVPWTRDPQLGRAGVPIETGDGMELPDRGPGAQHRRDRPLDACPVGALLAPHLVEGLVLPGGE